MRRRLFPFPIALLLTLGLPAGAAAAQERPEPPRSVIVTGEGVVRVVPDVAIVRFGVVTQGEDAAEVRRLNAEAAAEALNAVRALGIPEENIQLQHLRLQPRTEWDPQRQRQVDLGYEAVRDVSVRVENLDLLPDLVARVVEAGANRLHGIQYDLSNEVEIRNRAIREALLAARAKAVLMAATLDVELGPVLQIVEGGFDVPRPMVRAEAFAMDMAKTAPEPDAYAAGEIEVRTTVQVSFGLR